MKEELLENADKYGLSEVVGDKISIIDKPLQLTVDDTIYLLENPDYTKDINCDLYRYLIQEVNNNNKLMLLLYKQMIIEKKILCFERYNGKNIDLNNLKNEVNSFKNIVYNPDTSDKFIAIIDVSKSFIHIYEFIANSTEYKAKYIHAKYETNSNHITHLDYSINQYTEEQYKKIILNPNVIEKCDNHKKIWRLDGNIELENFYNIIFCMFDKNEYYIKELFNI